MSTHLAHFWQTPLPQKQEIPEKMEWWLPVFLLKFRSGELVGCGIKFHIQRVPTRHTFDEPRYPKKKKYLKKHDDDVIITSSPDRNLSKNTRYVENTKKQSSFFYDTYPQIYIKKLFKTYTVFQI